MQGQMSLRDNHPIQRSGLDEVKSGFKRIESTDNLGIQGGDMGSMYQEMS